jgi:hypothetical protein
MSNLSIMKFDGNLVNSWIRQGVCMWLWAKLCQLAYIYCIVSSGCNWIYVNILVHLFLLLYVVYTGIQILYFFYLYLKFSKKICIGYFYTVNLLYYTAEYIIKFINLWNKNYLLPFTCLQIKKIQYLYTRIYNI